ncbi:hypothetical protein OPV22_003317 [Ensete ventricosum]|uniref:VWFA domain-containing protein n=1 Tax=Ensete ventricosum TaxID=4639 RepID=A0AAV8S082_ENSVE|nr:hypothetical protein OPV22_003317 [Ensete ventricosum]
MGTGGWRRAFCTSVGGDPETAVATRREAGERRQLSPSTRSCAKLIFFSGGGRGGSNPSTPRLDEGLRCRTTAMSPDRPKLQCEMPVDVTTTLSIGTPNPRSRSPALFRRKAFSAPSSPRSPSRFGLFKHLSSGRLSVVAFSAAAGAKRLIPLRRMSRQGQRAARQIVDRLLAVVGREAPAKGANVGDALRKAAKVLQDRRERNPVATIMLLSDSGQQQLLLRDHGKKDDNHHHKPLYAPRDSGGDIHPHPLSTVTSDGATCFTHLEIPLVASGCGDKSAGNPPPQKHRQMPNEDAFIKCVGGLLSVVMRDVRLQLIFPTGDISAVYPCSGRSCVEVALRGGSSVLRLGDLYAEEEREMLVEMRVPVSSAAAAGPQNGHHQLVVKCNYRDPATQELTLDAEQILLLPPELSRDASSSACSATPLRLRNLFVSTRAVAESRRLADVSDCATAHHPFSSACSLLLQSASDAQDHHLIQNLDEELADLQRRRLPRAHHQPLHLHRRQHQQQEECLASSGRRRRRRQREVAAGAEVGGEPITPTSAWRAAEQLAKVAIIRKSLNRVSDLHGFENARF